jgi:hypothetical protein
MVYIRVLLKRRKNSDLPGFLEEILNELKIV